MKPKFYSILSLAIQNGIQRGYRRACKHSETPSEAHIEVIIHHEIMNEICEYFEFDG